MYCIWKYLWANPRGDLVRDVLYDAVYFPSQLGVGTECSQLPVAVVTMVNKSRREGVEKLLHKIPANKKVGL